MVGVVSKAGLILHRFRLHRLSDDSVYLLASLCVPTTPVLAIKSRFSGSEWTFSGDESRLLAWLVEEMAFTPLLFAALIYQFGVVLKNLTRFGELTVSFRLRQEVIN